MRSMTKYTTLYHPVSTTFLCLMLMACGSHPSRYSSMEIASQPASLAEKTFNRPPAQRENYAQFSDNPLKLASEQSVSTFSIDVDTAAYANVRRFINHGQLPPAEAVRVEELINYFDYDYPLPENADQPFHVLTEIGPAPWNANTQLLHIGIKAYDYPDKHRRAKNLVFLIDVSGSMHDANKLGLLKQSFGLLVKQLNAQDRVAIVVYAGASGVVLTPTPGDQATTIINALDQLQAGGSTNGAAGIQLAYQMAEQAFIKDGINRVILATDGDFNVGPSSVEELKQLIRAKKKTGTGLTVLGFGMGNYNDHLMEVLSNQGDGNAAYIDTLQEAQKVLVHDINATLDTVAKDTKIQIEFNPSLVAEYRLIGYENRMLQREDFNNDKVDAGDIGAGHTVTALYELTLVGQAGRRIDPLRYSSAQNLATNQQAQELGFLNIRYKRPNQNSSQLLSQAIAKPNLNTTLKQTSQQFRFAAAVAAFGQQLRDGKYLQDYSYDQILNLAQSNRGQDPFGYRHEFIRLVDLVKTLEK